MTEMLLTVTDETETGEEELMDRATPGGEGKTERLGIDLS